MFAQAAAGALLVLAATAGLILGCGSASEWSRSGTLGVRVIGLATTPAPANGGSVSVTTSNVPGNVGFPGTLPDSGIAFGEVLPGDYTITYTPPGGYLLADGEVSTKTAQVTYAQAIEVNFNVVAAPAPTGTLTITVTGFGAGAAGGSAEVLRTDIGGQVAQTVAVPVSGSIGVNVVAGTYSVTYTPPTGFSMAGGAAGTLTGVAVTAGGTSSASFAVQRDPTNGTLVVSVTGLTGSPANGGSAVAQRTDSAGSPITIPVSVAGNGSNANVPAGTYSVTYTPPSGFTVAGGATSTATGVAVTTGLTSTVPFVVQVNPTNGTLVVNVTGLTGFPANGGSAVAQRTDAAGAPITIAVSAGTGSGSNASVPAGTYTITYTPPSGFSVAGGVTNPVTGTVVSAGAGATVSFAVQADPTTGTLVVSVAGLTGSPANGGSAVAQRTDAAGSPITINVLAAGSGSSSSVPAGTYRVTYTPPSDFGVTGTNPVTGKGVSAGATATATFAVQALSSGTPVFQDGFETYSNEAIVGLSSARTLGHTENGYSWGSGDGSGYANISGTGANGSFTRAASGLYWTADLTAGGTVINYTGSSLYLLGADFKPIAGSPFTVTSNTSTVMRFTANATGAVYVEPFHPRVSNTMARLGSQSLKFVFGPCVEPPTVSGTYSASRSEQRFSFGVALTEGWLEYWLYVPANYAHRTNALWGDNNKFLVLWRDEYGVRGQDVIALETTTRELDAPIGASALHPYIGAGNGDPSGRVWHTAPHNFISATGALRPGQWNGVRLHFKEATSAGPQDRKGGQDGIIQLWTNNGSGWALVWNVTDANLYPSPESLGHGINWLYLMGAQNSGFAQRTVFYVDDFKVYAVNPGW